MNREVICRWGERFLSPLGFALHRKCANYHYVPDYYGTKAHKYRDLRTMDPFGRLAGNVISENRTKLYYDRLHTLYNALTQSKRSIAPGESFTICEVGTYRGGTMKFLCLCCEDFRIPYKAIVCDTFEGHDARDVEPSLTNHREGEFGDTSDDVVREYLKDYSVQVVKGRIQQRLSEFPEKIHFLHLDVDLYDPTAFGLAKLGERICCGGAVVVDDHGFTTCPGIERAVDEFLQSEIGKSFFCLPLSTGQCVLIRVLQTF